MNGNSIMIVALIFILVLKNYSFAGFLFAGGFVLLVLECLQEVKEFYEMKKE